MGADVIFMRCARTGVNSICFFAREIINEVYFSASARKEMLCTRGEGFVGGGDFVVAGNWLIEVVTLGRTMRDLSGLLGVGRCARALVFVVRCNFLVRNSEIEGKN